MKGKGHPLQGGPSINVTLTLQKPEGFRVKAPEGEVVVLYFEPSATQNLKPSGFPAGETTWQYRPHPSNSPMGGYPIVSHFAMISAINTDYYLLFAMLFMQLEGLRDPR